MLPKSLEATGIVVGSYCRSRRCRLCSKSSLESPSEVTAGVAVAVYAGNRRWNHRRRKSRRKELLVSRSAQVEKKKGETSIVGFISLYVGFEI